MSESFKPLVEILDEHFDINVVKDKTYLNVYPYGSRVYGCNQNGDRDLIVVMDIEGKKYETQYTLGERDMSFYAKNTFEEMLHNHEISALECFFLPSDLKIKETFQFDFELDLKKLRNSISQTSSNSFVKAKKKLTVEKDFNPYIARKSLFHSLRILMFGIQIAKYGEIVSYSEANFLWDEIINNPSEKWEDYKTEYQPFFNKLHSEFKKLAPK